MSKDAKFFQTTKKGEIHEIKEDLDSTREDRKKDAVKKVIADMTVGKDVSMLFMDVVKCINTSNLELKKLVYLYIMNYAKSQPDLAILSVNSFVKDAESPNPLIRALAIRTMGCIRVNKITEYLCEPLRKCLKDSDPYVRKTAAVCVAKLYDINAELVSDQGFLDALRDLLSDKNPMVVANAVAALAEIDETSKVEVFRINQSNLNKLLAALNECTEWGQVFILNSLSSYTPKDSKEAENIAERVTPRLNHVNSAVVLGAVKVLMKYMDSIQGAEIVKGLCRKMGPPLVTLLSKEPEIQYVALRNINLIIQKRPSILQSEMKVFFCKYNDPIYVKMEKLEIMVMLASERNIEQVLLEFKEYATEVDVEFVRKAVRAIGRCAIKLDKAAEKCIQVLLELIQTKVNYVVQEAIIVIKDIFRKYPNRYESIIATLCENLDTLDEPEAKASMIWIIGEYAERIDNADELLESFLENFKDENTSVQLQLLTATVKLFLKKPKETQKLVQTALDLATKETDNPDLRDRGFVYWRLLSHDPEAAKAVVLAEKPLITDNSNQLDPTLLDQLIDNISTLASVYHKPPETFVSKLKSLQKVKAFKQEEAQNEEESFITQDGAGGSDDSILDLVNLGDALPSMGAPNSGGFGGPIGGLDFLSGSGFGSTAGSVSTGVPKVLLLPADKGQGLQISGAFVRRRHPNGNIVLDLDLVNQGSMPFSGFAIQFNKNPFNLAPTATSIPIQPIAPGQGANYAVALHTQGVKSDPGTPISLSIQIAFKTNIGILYFTAELPYQLLFAEDGKLEKKIYLSLWQGIPDSDERTRDVPGVPNVDPAYLNQKLEASNIFTVARRKNDSQQDVMYMSVKTENGVVFLSELTLFPQNSGVRVCTRTQHTELVGLFEQVFQTLLQKP